MYNIPLILENSDESILNKIKKYVNFIDIVGLNYLYFISIDADYFNRNINLGFNNIPNYVKNDIRNGLCNVILYMGDDGNSGSETNHDLEILESWRIKNNFPEYSIHYFSMNLIISQVVNKKGIKICAYSMFYNSHTYVDTPFKITDNSFFDIGIPTEFDYKLFLNYNQNPHKHRIYFILKLIENSLLNDGLVSFSDFPEEYHKYDFYHLISNSNFSKNTINTFENLLPIKINNLYVHDYTKNLGQSVVIDDFKKTFFSVISETLVSDNTIYISEKTTKAIAVGHPFFLISSKNSLKKLKELGYKTFDKWWDESYDMCDDYMKRIDMIISEIEKIKLKSYTELVNMRNDMYGVLHHNQQVFKKICSNDEQPVFDTINKIYKNISE